MRIGISIFGCNVSEIKGPGISIYCKNLIRNLAVVDKVNKYFIFLSKDNIKYINLINRNNIYLKVIPIHETGITRIIFEQFLLPVLSILYRIDIMHYAASRMPFAFSPKAVITIQDLMYRFYGEYFKGHIPYYKYLYFDLNLKMALKKAVRVIAASQYTAKEIQKYFHVELEKINVIHNGIDPLFLMELKEDVIQDNKLKDEKYILTVNSNLPHKNLKSIIESFILARKRYNILQKLIIVGNKRLAYNGFIKMIKESNLEKEVVFMENIPEKELLQLYRRASLFIFLSLNEGFGLPVLEAMAAGVPVVCSDRASLPEVVGDAAIIVDPFDIYKISEIINNCLDNEILRKEMIHRGIKRARELYWEKTALRTLEVYNQIK